MFWFHIKFSTQKRYGSSFGFYPYFYIFYIPLGENKIPPQQTARKEFTAPANNFTSASSHDWWGTEGWASAEPSPCPRSTAPKGPDFHPRVASRWGITAARLPVKGFQYIVKAFLYINPPFKCSRDFLFVHLMYTRNFQHPSNKTFDLPNFDSFIFVESLQVTGFTGLEKNIKAVRQRTSDPLGSLRSSWDHGQGQRVQNVHLLQIGHVKFRVHTRCTSSPSQSSRELLKTK